MDYKEWMGGGLVEADDFYASYYVNVIEDLKESLERYSNNYYQWYILALAQLRSGSHGCTRICRQSFGITQRYINRHGERTVKEFLNIRKKQEYSKRQHISKWKISWEHNWIQLCAGQLWYWWQELAQIYLNLGYAYAALSSMKWPARILTSHVKRLKLFIKRVRHCICWIRTRQKTVGIHKALSDILPLKQPWIYSLFLIK